MLQTCFISANYLCNSVMTLNSLHGTLPTVLLNTNVVTLSSFYCISAIKYQQFFFLILNIYVWHNLNCYQMNQRK